ncbi:MAG TPA: hypothetical protein ENG61_02190, partial [Candidatus Korarchaeota archaeon]|nr:hypothetical protein [Candidatus Korarchaeota archaeon]
DTYHLHKPRMAYERGFDYVLYVRGQEADPYIVDPKVKVNLSGWHRLNYLTEHDRKVFTQYLKNVSWWSSEEDHFIARVVKAGSEWLERQVNEGRRDRIFLWLDCFDPHEPWDPPEEYYNLYAPEDYCGLPIIHPFIGGPEGGLIKHFSLPEVRHVRAQYAGEVTLVDKWVGKFLEKVKELDLWENTLIIVLSDHGEPLGEHGIIRKVRPWPYEELSRIALLIKPPKDVGEGDGRVVDTYVQTPDILPTILEATGIPEERSRWTVNPKVQGVSLLPILRGEECEVREFAISGHYMRSWSIRDEDYSLYIWPPQEAEYTFGTRVIKERGKTEPELYRLKREYLPPKPEDWDIGEQPEKGNVIGEEQDVARELENKLLKELYRIKMDVNRPL